MAVSFDLSGFILLPMFAVGELKSISHFMILSQTLHINVRQCA